MTAIAREKPRIAVIGAGIYGSTIALKLIDSGYNIELFDRLGVLQAASGINQYRIHSGYHYPRSSETIKEILESRHEFNDYYAKAIVRGVSNFYAIPHEGSWTSRKDYEQIIRGHGLSLDECTLSWLDFHYIEAAYLVDEDVYDPEILRDLIKMRLEDHGVCVQLREFTEAMRQDYDIVVWATYGTSGREKLFKRSKLQVAEKVLVELPDTLRAKSLVVVDGPFTGFDPYGNTPWALFGSAKLTNHWSSTDPDEPVPEHFRRLLNHPEFEPVDITRFEAMRDHCALAVPSARDARYLGSRFTLRVVEDNPSQDRRVLQVVEPKPGEIHVFSGKVVSALKAAREVIRRIDSAAS